MFTVVYLQIFWDSIVRHCKVCVDVYIDTNTVPLLVSLLVQGLVCRCKCRLTRNIYYAQNNFDLYPISNTILMFCTIILLDLHKCLKCWWLAIAEQKTITKPLVHC